MTGKIIEVVDLSKKFLYTKTSRKSFFKGMITLPYFLRDSKEIWALKNVSFGLNQGESLGLVGKNGSGKSTLMRLLEGVYEPTHGKIFLGGETSLLQLGLGFNPELTVEDNVYIHGALMGIDRKNIDKIFDEIIDFAELNEYVGVKLRALSSGMFSRLAFSITIRTNSPIILLDEVFSVGDENFVKKCKKVMYEFQEKGRTIILSSHTRTQIEDFCEKTLVLDKGKNIFFGDTNEALKEYDGILKN